jgi:hypothetical protein
MHDKLAFPCQPRGQLGQADVAIALNPFDQLRAMGSQLATACGPTLTRRRQRPRLRYPLRQSHPSARAHPKPPRSSSPRMTVGDLAINPLPKIL